MQLAAVLLTILLSTFLAEGRVVPSQRSRGAARAVKQSSRLVLPLGRREDFTSEGPGSNSTYSFNLAAFQDGRRFLIRIYSELEPKYVEPIAFGERQKPHVSQCHLRERNGTTLSVIALQVDTQWAYGDAERIRTINKVIAYTIDCKDPGPGNWSIAPQLSTGGVLGDHIDVELMETERKGRLAACSQPLFTHMAGLQDWVDYHARLGVENFRMHVPVGDHIEALFDPIDRQKRIEETKQLNERSPESVGLERLRRFDHPLVKWHEYSGAPTANYYSETPLFNACVYSFRYAYDYVLLYDCDEWFAMSRGNNSRLPHRTISDFLDSNLPKNVASLQVDSFAFPAQCAVSDKGDFFSRFTLRKKVIWENMQKLVVRPLAVACTAIHGIFDMTEQFKQDHLNARNETTAKPYIKLPTDQVYIKHIRWFGPPNGTAISCKFGANAESWDPDFTLVVHDDAARRPSKETRPLEIASI